MVNLVHNAKRKKRFHETIRRYLFRGKWVPGVFPIMAYTGRIRSQGGTGSGIRFLKE